MTRINSNLNPKKLTDKHLFAEWREIKMVVPALKRSLNAQSKQSVLKKIPPKFTLNKGHVYFFYDKLKFLKSRYDELTLELIDRNFNINLDWEFSFDGIPSEFINDWNITDPDYSELFERLKLRINSKPHLYKYYGKALPDNWVDNTYQVHELTRD